MAQESFRNDSGRCTSEWDCSIDPWNPTTGVTVVCRLLSQSASVNSGSPQVVQNIYDAAARGGRLFSADLLRPIDREYLNGQLNNALKQPPPRPTATATPLKSSAGMFQHAPGAVVPPVDRSGPVYVSWLQRALNTVNGAGIPVAGDFGPVTDQAVRDFQASRGLDVDGVVGPVTEQALIDAGAPKPPGAKRIGEARKR